MVVMVLWALELSKEMRHDFGSRENLHTLLYGGFILRMNQVTRYTLVTPTAFEIVIYTTWSSG